MESKVAPDLGLNKVFGAPLQNLYRALLRGPRAPRQPELIRALGNSLAAQGLRYHPRTLKRQLLGSIEYIPESLETSLLEWLASHPVSGQKALVDNFRREKQALEKSQDESLYVPPRFLQNMADAYLFRHKDLSRRKLALQLSSSLQEKGVSIGLETLQAALSGKTQKVRKVLEEEMLSYFRKEGLADRAAVEAYLQEARQAGGEEVRKIEVGDLSEWADAYLLKHRGLSKRQLALRLQQRLRERGYAYHLSSLQSVLEGKTHKTRKVIVDTLRELLQAEGLDASEQISEFVRSAEGVPLAWSQYVDAKEVPRWVESLLQGQPGLTRRQIALQLQEDLRKQEFRFSLSTLQYLLAGKTQRIKQVVAETLEGYLKPGGLPNFQAAARRMVALHGGRQELQRRVLECYQRFQSAQDQDREALRQAFIAARWDLIRKIALKRSQPAPSRHPSSSRRRAEFEDPDATEVVFEPAGEGADIPVAYGVRESLDRLVS
ncbi:MAG: hypothetical protein U1F66_07175 [bacterium]